MNERLNRMLTCALFLLVFGAVQASAQVTLKAYDNIPNPLPGNLPSVAFEATGTSEFGDRIAFSSSSTRALSNVVVTMSSWGCQAGHWYSGDCLTAAGATFSHPITLNIYAAGSGPGFAPGTVLATVTQTFAIPYRPSADLVNCSGGRWYNTASNTCFNGKATNITFDLSSLNVSLPNQVIFGVAYNTSHYGYAPIGESPSCYTSSSGCGYDSLNVGTADPATTLSAGSNPSPNDAYQYTIYDSCSNGPVIPFGLDAGCWAGFKPAVQFNVLLKGDDCKDGGWQSLFDGSGQSFKNQGQCVSYSNNGK